MASYTRLLITSDTAAEFTSGCDLKPLGVEGIQNFQNYLMALSTGLLPNATLAFKQAAVPASGTITIASTGMTNDQTGTICGVTWTAKTSGVAGQANWTLSTTPNTSATNLAAAINAYAPFAGIVTAAVTATGVVTVTSAVPGTIGNGLVMASVNWSNTTVVSFADGTDGTAYTFSTFT